MCSYYPDAAKLGGAIMAGEGSTSAPSECFWWQVFLLPIWTSLTGLVLYLGTERDPFVEVNKREGLPSVCS